MKQRLKVVAALFVGVLVLGSSAAGAQAPPGGTPPLTVTGSPVEPGGNIFVSGRGCNGGSAVMVGVLDALSEGLLVSTTAAPGDEGTWSAPLTIPAGTGPGVYPVVARCSDHSGGDDDAYNGDDGYNGYNGYNGYGGYGSFDYPQGSVTVLPPASAPNAQGELIVTPNVIPAGGAATVNGAGWNPDEQLTIVMYSSPVVLGTLRSGNDGSMGMQIQIPVDTPLGSHTVCALNATAALNPVRNLCAPITVVAASATPEEKPIPVAVAGNTDTGGGALAFTGLEPWQLALVGLVLCGVGVAIYGLTRRSSAAD